MLPSTMSTTSPTTTSAAIPPPRIAARLPAEPGWRAVVATWDADGHNVACSLVPIAFWGIVPQHFSFGVHAAGGVMNMLLAFGGGASPPELVPYDEQGRALSQLASNEERFWGVAGPNETDEEIAAKFATSFEELVQKHKARTTASQVG